MRQPTHRRGHILDWLAAPEGSTLIHDVAVSKNAFTDHETLSFSPDIIRPQRQKHFVTPRNLKCLDSDRFHSGVKAICNSVLSESAEIDLGTYNISLRQVLDNYTPFKTGCVPVRPSAPWTGEEIREANRALHRTER